jgi:bacterioferritin-associated ferredoxin
LDLERLRAVDEVCDFEYHSQYQMIVCVCHNVSERKILNVIQDGATTVEQVTRRCEAGGDCGSCRDAIGELIEEHAQTCDPLRRCQRLDRRAA